MAVRECDNLSADLSALLDGELPEERARLVASHLLTCDGCRRMVEELRSVTVAIAQLPRKPAPLGTLAAIQQTLAQDAGRVAAARRAPRFIRIFVGITSAAAAVGLFTFAGWYALTRSAVRPPVASQQDFRKQVSGDEFAAGARREAERTTAGAGVRVAPAGGEGGGIDAALSRAQQPPSGALSDEHAKSTTGTEGLAAAGFERQRVPDATARREVAVVGPADGVVGGVSSEEGAAEIEVVVAPQTAAEYDAVLRVAFAEQAVAREGSALGRGVVTKYATPGAGAPLSEAAAEGNLILGGALTKTAAAGEAFVLDMQTASISGLIASLSREAPQRVNVALHFPAAEMQDVRRLFALDADALQTPAPQSEVGEVGGLRDDADRADATGRVSGVGGRRQTEQANERLKNAGGGRGGGGQNAREPVEKSPHPADDAAPAAADQPPARVATGKPAAAPRAEGRKSAPRSGDDQSESRGSQSDKAPVEAKSAPDAATEKKADLEARARGTRSAVGRTSAPATPRAGPVPAPAATPPAAPSRAEESSALPGAEDDKRPARAAQRPAMPPAPRSGAARGVAKEEADAEAYRQDLGAFGIDALGRPRAQDQAGFAASQPQDAASTMGYVALGIQQLGQRMVQMGESLLRFGAVAASHHEEYKSSATEAEANVPGPVAPAPTAAVRVRLVVLPPPAGDGGQPAASQPNPRSAP